MSDPLSTFLEVQVKALDDKMRAGKACAEALERLLAVTDSGWIATSRAKNDAQAALRDARRAGIL